MAVQTQAARLTATLPLPPSVNHLYARFADRVVLTDAGLAYHDEVAVTLRGQTVPPDVRFRVTIHLHFPDRRRRDLDNALKLLLDAVSRALGFDDSRIDELHVYRALDRQCPRAEVLLTWSAR
ncbi:MAG: RusA family crossover junction endodeoxyribonuclease [Chloroflexi bacterium]|nr:RusA family crossover junction endodeoxyribonuclease [Chloroflexota bacterium]